MSARSGRATARAGVARPGRAVGIGTEQKSQEILDEGSLARSGGTMDQEGPAKSLTAGGSQDDGSGGRLPEAQEPRCRRVDSHGPSIGAGQETR